MEKENLQNNRFGGLNLIFIIVLNLSAYIQYLTS